MKNEASANADWTYRRMGRLDFFVSNFGIALIAVILASSAPNYVLLIALSAQICAVIFYIKRLHDINGSGWWSVLCFAPYVGVAFGFLLLARKGTEGANKYGDPESSVVAGVFRKS